MKKLNILSPNHYNVFTAKEVNLPELKAALFPLFIIGLLSSPAVAVLYVEDFEYAKPDQNDFINGLFHHSIKELPPMDLPIWDISDEWSPPDGTALNLRPALDEITFILEPGEYIDYVSVDVISWADDTTVKVYYDVYFGDYSVQGEAIAEIPSGWDWGHPLEFDPSDSIYDEDRIEIYEVILSSSEGGFDNLVINVIPEPATLLLFGLGVAFLRKRHWLLTSRSSL